MFKYFETLPDLLETFIWVSIIIVFIGVFAGVIYKIFRAEKIKIGKIEIEDDEE